jgi:hypothetical protein
MPSPLGYPTVGLVGLGILEKLTRGSAQFPDVAYTAPSTKWQYRSFLQVSWSPVVVRVTVAYFQPPHVTAFPHPEVAFALSLAAVMLPRLSRSVSRQCGTRVAGVARRFFVQPSSADRANVVEVPSSYHDETHLAPRAGSHRIVQSLISRGLFLNLDMLGFKVEMPKREGSLRETTRPIYLDMQV